jgi:SAM-dependent methyltransferase
VARHPTDPGIASRYAPWMNDQHAELCSSAEWAAHLETILVPWALGDDPAMGDDVLEIGPGYGLVTDLLRGRVVRLTAVEIDPTLAGPLADRMAGTNVDVVVGDATDLPFPADRFTAAASFTMLHHVPTVELQDRIFAELARVLRPGGRLFGTDSLDSPDFRAFHDGDVCVPIDPLTLAARLERAGFVDIDIAVWSVGTRFRARA